MGEKKFKRPRSEMQVEPVEEEVPVSQGSEDESKESEMEKQD